MRQLAAKAIDLCRRIALCSEEPGITTRTFLSPPMRDVYRALGGWMEEWGMRVRVDDAGNLRGLREGRSPRLIVASHLDTVPNAGAFDGVLGVVLGIALVEALGDSTGVGIEVIGFSDEEGVRFGVPFIGSRAAAGTLRAEELPEAALAAIREFGLNPEHLAEVRLASDVAAYLEIHIEQGPVLESLNLPLGIVDAIAGQSRLSVLFRGKANHAGTTPMALRRDALAAAAEWIGVVERIASAESPLVATTGSINVEPNATNVIAGLARIGLDVRHACDQRRRTAVDRIITAANDIGARRGVRVEVSQRLDQPAVELNAALRERLARAVSAAGFPVHHLSSGAGHDAMILAPVVPSAMLFVRSPGGISHHPEESVLLDDVAAALEAAVRFARDWGQAGV